MLKKRFKMKKKYWNCFEKKWTVFFFLKKSLYKKIFKKTYWKKYIDFFLKKCLYEKYVFNIFEEIYEKYFFNIFEEIYEKCFEDELLIWKNINKFKN